MPTQQLDQLPYFDPAMFYDIPFDPSMFGIQNTSYDAPISHQPQPHPGPSGLQQQYPAALPEDQWPILPDIDMLGSFEPFDVNAVQQEASEQEALFFAQNGQYLNPYYQGAQTQWNA